MNPLSFNNNQKADAQKNHAANIMQGGLTSAAPTQVAPPQQDADSVTHLDILDSSRVSNQALVFLEH